MASRQHPQTLSDCSLCHRQSTEIGSVPCGHKFCQACSDGFLSEYERTGTYSCTQCLQTFFTRPDQDGQVHKIADKLSRTDLNGETLADSHAGPGDMACDICTGSKYKAVKSCLVCLDSYCNTHLRLHNDLHRRAAHTLIDASDQLQGMTCSVHDKVLEIYCRTEQRCICCKCMLDGHKGHDTVSVSVGRAEKEEELRRSKELITKREKQLKELNSAKITLREMCLAVEEESERLLAGLIDCMQSSQAELKVQVHTLERTELSGVERLQMLVEREIAELKNRDAQIELLSQTHNDIHFLQSVQSLSLTSADVTDMIVNPQFSFGGVITSISALKMKIENIWREEIEKIVAAVKSDKIIVPSEPKTREDFLQYLVPLSLNPDTAHSNLTLNEEKRAVACSMERQPYPDHPDRFDWWAQVLCREPLTSRCYWEAQWTGLFGVDIAVSYRDIGRKGEGDECGFGYNKDSWSLDCSISEYIFVHADKQTELPVPASHRIGVYLDYKEGVLCFYSVSDSMTLLHRVNTKFTQPLYAGFGVYQGSTANICQPSEEPKQTKTNEKANTNNKQNTNGKANTNDKANTKYKSTNFKRFKE